MLNISLRALAVAAVFFAGAAARADEYNFAGLVSPPAGTEAKWIIDMSAMVGVSPSYPGASTYSFYGLPGVSIRHFGQPERFSAPDDAVSLMLWHNDMLAVGASGNWVGSRAIRNNPALYGVEGVAASVELGAYFEVTPANWFRLRGDVRKAVSGYDGWVGRLSGDVWRKFGKWTLSVGPRLDFGNDEFANAFFSVEPWQAQLNRYAGGRLTAYDASGGLMDAGFNATVRYEISDAWRVSAFGTYKLLTDSAASSPIVKVGGSPNQLTAGVELRYSFRTKALYWLPGFF